MSNVKKIKRNIEKNTNLENEVQVSKNHKRDFVNLGIIVISIVLFLSLAFVFTKTFITKDWNPTVPVDDTQKPVDIDYESILAANALKQLDEEYYVVFTDKANLSVFTNYKAQESKKDLLPIYNVDLDEFLNQHILAAEDQEYSKEPKNIDELFIGQYPTVIHVKNGEIIDFKEGELAKLLLDVAISSANEK